MQSYAREGYSSAPPTFTIYDDDSLRAPNIRPPFPPDVSAVDLAELALSKIKTGKSAKPANAFIAYRTVFHRYLKDSGRYLTMPRVSSMSKLAWNEEDDLVKSFYKALANEAKKIYYMRLSTDDTDSINQDDISGVANANNNIVDVPTSNNSSAQTTPYLSTPADFTPDMIHSSFSQHVDIYSSAEDNMLSGNIMPPVAEIMIRRDEQCGHDGGSSDGMQVDDATTQGTNIISNIEHHIILDSINVPHDLSQNMVHMVHHEMTAHNIGHDGMAHDMPRETTQGILESTHDFYQDESFHLIQQQLQAGHNQPIYLTEDNMRDPAVLALLSRINHLERMNDMVLRQLVHARTAREV